MRGQPGFFDVDDRLKRLSDLGDQLEACQAAMDFETFHPQLNSSRICQAYGFHRMNGQLAGGLGNLRDAGHDHCVLHRCLGRDAHVSRRIGPNCRRIGPNCRRCPGEMLRRWYCRTHCGGRRRPQRCSHTRIHGTCPLAAGLHSADSHDGRDDGVDFLGRSLFIRLFIAGRILAGADV
jgi:hypothetical protein